MTSTLPYIFHLPIGADEPVVCGNPARCTLGVHVSTVEEAEKMKAERDHLKNTMPVAWTKNHRPVMKPWWTS